jgi:hypothetical protein
MPLLKDNSSHSSLFFYPEGEGRTVNVLLEIFILSRYWHCIVRICHNTDSAATQNTISYFLQCSSVVVKLCVARWTFVANTDEYNFLF